MYLHLFSERPPKGRCLILAQKLCEICKSADGLRIAEALFAFLHTRNNPAILEIRNPNVISDIQRVCVEFGINIEVREN